MSVLARNRRQAATEVEMNCARLVVLTTQRADRIPARYKKFVRPRLMELTTSAYHAAIMANEADGRTDAGRAERRKLFERSIRYLTALQKPLVVYWSLFDSKEGGRVAGPFFMSYPEVILLLSWLWDICNPVRPLSCL